MDGAQNKFLTTPDITFRNLLCVLRVAEFGSVSRAAEEVTRSQSAVTKAINKVEKAIQISLFDRSAAGMRPTAAGEVLAKRITNAYDELHRAGQFYQRQSGLSVDPYSLPLFTFGSPKHALAHFACVYDHRDPRKAAAQSGVSLPTIQRSIRELSSQLGVELFEKAASGQVTPTLIASEIARSIKLAFTELGLGLDEIACMEDEITGHVRIGTLPFVRKEIIPNAIVKLLSKNHRISISTNEADYNAQEVALRSGDLDLIVGPTTLSDDDPDLVASTLAYMPLRFVVHEKHPLAKAQKKLSKSDLEKIGWILPPRGSAHRNAFDRFMNMHGIPINESVVETSLFTACRSIAESSGFAFLSRLGDSELGPFVALALDFVPNNRPSDLFIVSHILTRRRTTMSPAVRLFISLLRESAEDAERAREH